MKQSRRPSPVPEPQGYEAAIRESILGQLKDPESARIRFVAPRRAWGRAVGTPGTVYCWMVTAYVNARNSYGGYAGEEPWDCIFGDGRLLSTLPALAGL